MPSCHVNLVPALRMVNRERLENATAVSETDVRFGRKEFHSYLKRLVDVGFVQRIKFGSEQIDLAGCHADRSITGTSQRF